MSTTRPAHKATEYPVAVPIGVLVISAMMMILNETTVAVALPAIMAEFAVPALLAQWLLTGFLLTMAVVIPTTGYLIQRFPTRALYFSAMGVFIGGSVLAAIAPVFEVLLAARVVQALGTAVMMPLMLTVVFTLVAPQRRGSIMGLIAVVMSVGPALGPSLAGIILHSYSWHHIFWAVVPIPALAIAVAAFFLPNVGEIHRSPFDLVSVLVSVPAFGGVVYGLSTLGGAAAGNAVVPLAALAAGGLFLGVFIVRQVRLSKRDRALLDLSAFTHRNFTLSVIAIVAAFAVFLGTVNTLPIYLQVSLGFSTIATGMAMLPGGLAQGVVSPIIGRIYDAVGPRPLAIPGAVILLVSQWWLYFAVAGHPELWVILVLVITTNIGVAMVLTPLMTVSLSALPQSLYSHGSAILNTVQQLGGAVGTALFIAAMSVGSRQAGEATEALAQAQAEGMANAFLTGGIITLAVVAAVVFVRPIPQSAAHEDAGAGANARADHTATNLGQRD